MKHLLLLTGCITFLLLHLSAGTRAPKKSSKLNKPKDKLGFIFQDLKAQLNVKYFVVVSVIPANCKSSIQVRTLDLLIQKMTKTTAAVCFLFNHSKFARKGDKPITAYVLDYYKRNMPATETARFIYVLAPGNRKSVSILFEEILGFAYEYYVGNHSVPKLLMVAIVEKKTGEWKQRLEYLFRRKGFFDINVLEILIGRRKSKPNADVIHRCSRMYHLNPFSKQFFSSPIRKGIKWFPDKLHNLHGYPLYVLTTKEVTEMWAQRKVEPDIRQDSIGRTDFIKSLPKVLNVTSKKLSRHQYIFNENKVHLIIFDKMMPPRKSKYLVPHIYPMVKPLEQLIEVMFVPVIYYEEVVESDNTVVLTSVATLVMLVVAIYLWTLAFDINPWSPLSIFGMIVVQPNPRTPVTRFQYVLFICLIAVGFFFGSELTQGLTSSNIVVPKERKLESFNDLRENNITVLLNQAVRKGRKGKGNGMKLTPGNVTLEPKWRQFLSNDTFKKRVIENLLLLQNYSISTAFEDHSGVHFPAKVVENNVVLAKKSNIISDWRIITLRMPRSNSYVNRVSDIYWRYFEAGLRNHRDHREYSRKSRRKFNEFRDQAIDRQMEEEEQLNQMESLSIFFYLVTIGPLASLVVLILELAFNLIS